MYAGYGSASPPLTNNPFLTQTAQSVTSRFPDISSSIPNDNNLSFASRGSGSTITGGTLPQQQQSGLYQQFTAQNPYGSAQLGYGMIHLGAPTAPTLPSPPPFHMQGYDNTFGQQQFTPNVSGGSYSYLSKSQQQPNSSYNPARQQLQNNPGYIAQFDPYGAIGQGWEGGASGTASNHFSSIGPSISTGSTLSTASSTSSSFSSSPFGVGPTGDSHPRDYIRTHKSQVEAWDAHAWKQLLNSFETLKSAWDERKAELMTRAKDVIAQGQTGMAYGGYFAQQIQQEAAKVQQLLKEAETNFDSVAASLFQMQEVFHGYRQSGDASSKSRVREATNAALKSLPGWPLPI